MMTTDQKFDLVPSTRTVLSPIDSMTDALTTERRLLDELISVMRRQRSAVGDDDLQRVDDSVFATHRVLVTLNEARRRRRGRWGPGRSRRGGRRGPTTRRPTRSRLRP